MLQALDYLTEHRVIHRDVKPENILATKAANEKYSFQLADFGLCNIADSAQTQGVGSPIYMAPELQVGSLNRQTTKVDVWALFVTLAMVLNAGGFRSKPNSTLKLRMKAVEEATRTKELRNMKEMAIVNPEQRASAADMLDKHFQGRGRTTTSNQSPLNRAVAREPRSRVMRSRENVVSSASSSRRIAPYREVRMRDRIRGS